MAKTESTFKNMVLSLTLISLGASASLGFVYVITKEPIEISVRNKKLNAIRDVVPEFNNNPGEDVFLLPTGEGDSLEVYPARKDNELVGYAINTYSKTGFAGTIRLVAGFRSDGTIIDITVLEQNETPGLGTKMTEQGFRQQFREKNPGEFLLKVKKDGGQVDAITAATISSRAFCDALQRAYNTIFQTGQTDSSSGASLTVNKEQSGN